MSPVADRTLILVQPDDLRENLQAVRVAASDLRTFAAQTDRSGFSSWDVADLQATAQEIVDCCEPLLAPWRAQQVEGPS